MNITKGQKIDITKNTTISEIAITLEWKKPAVEMDIDGAAFLLKPNGQCKNDEHFIFYGQPTSIDGSVTHVGSSAITSEIHLSLKSIPDTIAKVALTLTIHEGEVNGNSFGQVGAVKMTIKDRVNRQVLGTFDFGQELKKETAIVVGELYRHNGEWKLNAVGMGFNGGLPALCENFGLEVENPADNPAPDPIPVPTAKPKPEPKPAPQAAVLAPKKPVPLNINLKKKASISIEKSSQVVASLEWANKKKDLDLYCFYVLKTGETGKVYYKNKGDAKKVPFITLDKDAKNAGKETITIHDPSQLAYVLFAAYSALSNGVGSFKSMEAKTVVDNQMGQVVTSSLYEENKNAYWVAIAHIDFTQATEMSVRHIETYSKPRSERSPVLDKNGEFKMDAGPIEFKNPFKKY